MNALKKSLLFINEWREKQDNTDEIKKVGENLITIENEVQDLYETISQLENDLDNADRSTEIGDLEYEIEELKKRPNILPATLNDEFKIKVLENLYQNLSLELLENLEKTVITAFEQEGKTYLTF